MSIVESLRGSVSGLVAGIRAARKSAKRRLLVGANYSCELQRLEDRTLLSADIVTVNWRGVTMQALDDAYIVQTRNNINFAKLAVNTGLAIESVTALGGNGFFRFTTPTLTLDEVDAWARAQAKSIAAISPDGTVYKADTFPNEKNLVPAAWTQFWHLENIGQTINGVAGTAGADIKAYKAWDITTGSRSVVVAVMDTGIGFTVGNPSGPVDTLPNIWRNVKEVAYGFATGDLIDNDLNGIVDDVYGAYFGTTPVTGLLEGFDPDGHGTFVASEIGAVGNNAALLNPFTGQNPGVGVNWQVSMMNTALDLFQGNVALVSQMVNAINYIIYEKSRGNANVVAINMSFGDIFFGTPTSNPALQPLQQIINLAGQNGIITVTASGNSGLDNDSFPHFPSNTNNAYVISVAATDNNDQLAPFSNYGARTVHLAAPGVDIAGLDQAGNLVSLSGTSMAAPLVTGVLALMKAANPSATASQLIKALYAGVDVLPQLQGKVISGGRLNAFKAVQNIIGEQNVMGFVDVYNPQMIHGWAYDKNAGKSPVTITVAIDGVMQAPILANLARADLTSALGDPNHAFVFNMPTLSPGIHTVQVYMTDVTTAGTPGQMKLLYTSTINGNVLPYGSIDVANSLFVAGWAFDFNDGINATTIRIDVDGVQGTPFQANQARPDLVNYIGSANHGYLFSLPTTLTPGPHRIDVWGIDNPTSALTKIGSVTIIKNVPPTTYVDAINLNSIMGWSVDMDDPNRTVQLQVAIDGVFSGLFAANQPRPDLVSVVGAGPSTNHGFTFVMPPLTGGLHTVALYATDVNTGAATKVWEQVISGNKAPIGSLDPTNLQFVGWAQDPDHPDVPLMVRVDIDDSQGQPVLANITRPDLFAAINSPNHGFATMIPQLTAGRHTARLYAYDPDTNVPALIATRIITTPQFSATNFRPTGSVDAFFPGFVGGWAYDPNAASGAIMVRVDIDGVEYAQVPASSQRADLAGVKGIVGTFHGFVVSLPTLSPGDHKVDVYAMDTTNFNAVLLKSGYVNQQPPTGYFDYITSRNILGWVQNGASSSPPLVRVDVDGKPGNVFSANFARGDGLPGFYLPTPPLGPGAHTVSLYVIDPVSLNATLVAQNTAVGKTSVQGHVDLFTTTMVYGWALDPESGSAPVNVVINIDGVDAIAVVANESRPDLVPGYGSANHGFTYFFGNTISSGTHRIIVKVVDPVTGVTQVIDNRLLTFS